MILFKHELTITYKHMLWLMAKNGKYVEYIFVFYENIESNIESDQ